jgi:hypothetical protein
VELITEVAFICCTNSSFNNSLSDSQCSVELSESLLTNEPRVVWKEAILCN